MFATGCEDKVVRIFRTDGPNVQPIKTFTGHTAKVFHIRWSPLREGVLCSGSDDNTVRVWDVAQDQCVCRLSGHTAAVRGLTWNYEVPYLLVSGSWDSSVRVWDIRDGACLFVIMDHGADVYGLTCHPSRPFLMASCSRDSTLRLWSLTPLVQPVELNLLACKPLAEFVGTPDHSMCLGTPPMLTGGASGALRDSLAKLSPDNLHPHLLTAFSKLLSPPMGTHNLWDLVSVAVGGDVMTLSPGYKNGIVHTAHLIRFRASQAQQLEMVKMSRFGAAIGKPSKEDQLREAALIHIRLGNTQRYCELMVELGEWERALAVSPGVSVKYWKSLAERSVPPSFCVACPHWSVPPSFCVACPHWACPPSVWPVLIGQFPPSVRLVLIGQCPPPFVGLHLIGQCLPSFCVACPHWACPPSVWPVLIGQFPPSVRLVLIGQFPPSVRLVLIGQCPPPFVWLHLIGQCLPSCVACPHWYTEFDDDGITWCVSRYTEFDDDGITWCVSRYTEFDYDVTWCVSRYTEFDDDGITWCVSRYAEFLRQANSEDIIPFAVATGNAEQLVRYFHGNGQYQEAMVSAQAACEDALFHPHLGKKDRTHLQPESSEADRHRHRQLLQDSCLQLSERHFINGSPVLAACCHLAIDDFQQHGTVPCSFTCSSTAQCHAVLPAAARHSAMQFYLQQHGTVPCSFTCSSTAQCHAVLPAAARHSAMQFYLQQHGTVPCRFTCSSTAQCHAVLPAAARHSAMQFYLQQHGTVPCSFTCSSTAQYHAILSAAARHSAMQFYLQQHGTVPCSFTCRSTAQCHAVLPAAARHSAMQFYLQQHGTGAMCKLLRGNELELAISVGTVLGNVPSHLRLATHLLSRRCEHLGKWELGVELLRTVPDSQDLLTRLCARCAASMDEINQLHQLAGLPSMEECLQRAECQDQDPHPPSLPSLLSTVGHYLLSTEPERGLTLGLSFLKDKLAAKNWTVDDLSDMLQLLGCMRTNRLQHHKNTVLMYELLALSSYVGALMAIRRGYHDLVPALFRHTREMMIERMTSYDVCDVDREMMIERMTSYDVCDVDREMMIERMTSYDVCDVDREMMIERMTSYDVCDVDREMMIERMTSYDVCDVDREMMIERMTSYDVCDVDRDMMIERMMSYDVCDVDREMMIERMMSYDVCDVDREMMIERMTSYDVCDGQRDDDREDDVL
ncbi:hypothetical protein ACOMHN_062737 [Nucella lapillus]